YQITIEVRHFAAWLGGESTLLARWSVLDRAERELLSQKVHLNAPTGGRDYEALVVAMTQVVEALSRDIAAAIQRLASPAAARE
ncbi:MAG: ABC-type transport auxiliary lipoprotein family protein, partial [Candidatus Entotheonellia bacterium]